MSAIRTLVLVLALLSPALLPPPAASQVAALKFKGKVNELWNLGTYFVNPDQTAVYDTVPEGRRLIVTDLLLTNPNASAITGAVDAGPGSLTKLLVVVPPESTFHHSWASGLVFEPGEEVSVRMTGTQGQAQFHLSGYLVKAKK